MKVLMRTGDLEAVGATDRDGEGLHSSWAHLEVPHIVRKGTSHIISVAQEFIQRWTCAASLLAGVEYEGCEGEQRRGS